jgi:hypothetical protein
VLISRIPREDAPTCEGVRQLPVDVPGGRSRALARTARSHIQARKGGIRVMAKKAKKAAKKAAKKR